MDICSRIYAQMRIVRIPVHGLSAWTKIPINNNTGVHQ